MNFAKFLRLSFLQNTFGQLHLKMLVTDFVKDKESHFQRSQTALLVVNTFVSAKQTH